MKDRGSQPKDARGIGLEQFAKKMPKDGCKEDADSSDKSSQHGKNAVRKEDADRHRTRVASHTETPLGVSKWLGKRHHTRNLAFR